jgi:hypothetical protein
VPGYASPRCRLSETTHTWTRLSLSLSIACRFTWQLLRREGADGRVPLATAKLVEVTGAASLDELRHRLGAVMAEARGAHTEAAASGENMPMELTAS